MKEIILTTGQTAFVDDEDFDFVKGLKWFSHKNKHLIYARRNTPGFTNKKFLMHREILGIKNPKIHVDHIDGNGLNNQKNNLRICSHSQNMRNSTKRAGTSSRFKGVSKCGNRWRVQVRRLDVGRYDSEIEAALAYNVAASFAFKEFAKLNKIDV